MPRVFYLANVTDQYGVGITGATVTILPRYFATPIAAYTNSTGTTRLATPLLTVAGKLGVWLDDTIGYNITVTGTGIQQYTDFFDAISAETMQAYKNIVVFTQPFSGYATPRGPATPIGRIFDGYATPQGRQFDGYATPQGRQFDGYATPTITYATPLGRIFTGYATPQGRQFDGYATPQGRQFDGYATPTAVTAPVVVEAASTAQFAGGSGTNLVYQGFSVLLSPGLWDIFGTATMWSSGAADAKSLGFWNDNLATPLVSSGTVVSGAAADTPSIGNNGAFVNKQIIRFATPAYVKLIGYRNGASTVNMGNTGFSLPQAQRITAFRLSD